MDINTAFQELNTASNVTFQSTPTLAGQVTARAGKFDQERAENDQPLQARPKQVVPIPAPQRGNGKSISPWQLLHTFARATALAGQGSGRALAQHWDCLRYITALHANQQGRLELTTSGKDWRFHKRGIQARELGNAFGLATAQHVMQLRHPDHRFDVVDAELVLDAVYALQGAGKTAREHTKLRPNYFLVGRKPSAPLRIVAVDSRGSHGAPEAQHDQLAKSGPRVHAMVLGDSDLNGMRPPGLLLSTGLLADGGIETRLLIAEGNGLLTDTNGSAPTLAGPADDVNLFPSISCIDADGKPTSRPGFAIPRDHWGWLSRILARTTAASLLTFAGNRDAARDLLTKRQQQRLGSANSHSAPGMRVDTRIDLGGMTFEGTDHVFRLDHRRVEVFSGLLASQHALLKDGRLDEHEDRLPGVLNSWQRNEAGIARDWNGIAHMDASGAVLAIRVQRKNNRPLP